MANAIIMQQALKCNWLKIYRLAKNCYALTCSCINACFEINFERLLKEGKVTAFFCITAFCRKVFWCLYGNVAQKPYFNVGDYKKLANEVGGYETCKPVDTKEGGK